jgi:hypothetical protein
VWPARTPLSQRGLRPTRLSRCPFGLTRCFLAWRSAQPRTYACPPPPTNTPRPAHPPTSPLFVTTHALMLSSTPHNCCTRNLASLHHDPSASRGKVGCKQPASVSSPRLACLLSPPPPQHTHQQLESVINSLLMHTLSLPHQALNPTCISFVPAP